MTLRSTRLGLALLTLVLTCLGCGTGGGGGDAGPQPEAAPPPAGTPYGTTSEHVLVQPVSALQLVQIVLDYGSENLGLVPGTTFFKLRTPTGQTPTGFVTALESDGRVVAAELDLGLSAPEGSGLTVPAGGLLISPELPTQADIARLGLPAAHGRVRGAGVRVAVLDSGVVFDHPFLAGRLEPGGYDFIEDDADPSESVNGLDDDENGFTDEGFGHGTFAAGMVLVVAPEATILPVRVLGSDLFGTSSGVAAAITYAANSGVHVINLSVVLPAEVQVVREAIQNARALGVVVIGAAGNSGAEDVPPSGGPDAAFLVAAVASDDARAPFSSFGPGVSISAPGVDMHGAFPVTDPDTAIWSGTSFSAPIITGAYALVREAHPLMTPDQALAHLQSTSVDISGVNPGLDGKLGAGRIDLDAATAAP